MQNNFDLNKVVEQLEIVKKEFIKDKDELKVSKRKDVVAVELKSILDNNNTYIDLKNAIEQYIENLYKI